MGSYKCVFVACFFFIFIKTDDICYNNILIAETVSQYTVPQKKRSSASRTFTMKGSVVASNINFHISVGLQ